MEFMVFLRKVESSLLPCYLKMFIGGFNEIFLGIISTHL